VVFGSRVDFLGNNLYLFPFTAWLFCVQPIDSLGVVFDAFVGAFSFGSAGDSLAKTSWIFNCECYFIFDSFIVIC
jgi:hypothetical protein